MSLNLAVLRHANRLRLPEFKNKQGLPAHSQPDGSDWSVSDWVEAILGELGEFANIHKKFRRGDITFEEYREKGGKELADVMTYLDLLALRALDMPGTPHATGFDLGEITVAKFNEVSRRVGSSALIVQIDGRFGTQYMVQHNGRLK